MTHLMVTRAEAMEELDQTHNDEDVVVIAMCHGSPRCDRDIDAEEDPQPCAWCFRYLSNDPRSPEQLAEAMDRAH